MEVEPSEELARALSAVCGVDLSRAEVRAVGGGSIHTTRALRAGAHRFFLKSGAAAVLPMFEAEVDGLTALAACDAFRVPRVFGCGLSGDEAWLLLEYLDLRPLAGADEGARFGAALAELHGDIGASFGWACDNFIGASPQINTSHAVWARFFIDCRLRPQLQRARERGYGGALGAEADAMLERVPALFLDYCPRPSLVHGDLWHGNAAVDAEGRPVLFDPAVYRADREVDLAMSELFGGFPPAFYAAYRKARPLAEGYEQRKTLYNLYHVLNHLNLFGRAYLGQAERMVRALA